MIFVSGEILVDVFKEGKNKSVKPGGAPFNVACNISAIGGDVVFYGAVGDDEYGNFLCDFANKKSFKSIIKKHKYRQTTEAFVELKNGERSFTFKRDNGADFVLSSSELLGLDYSKINVIHLGSLMLSYDYGRRYFKQIISTARRIRPEILISFDVNFREDIYTNVELAKESTIESMSYAHIVKISNDELSLLSGTDDIEEALKTLFSRNQHVFVTLGKDGSLYYHNGKIIRKETKMVTPIDTTGAGDAFFSYVLYAIDKQGLKLEDSQIEEILKYANNAGAIATQKIGAIDTISSLDEVINF